MQPNRIKCINFWMPGFTQYVICAIVLEDGRVFTGESDKMNRLIAERHAKAAAETKMNEALNHDND